MFFEMISTRCNIFLRKHYYCGEKEFGGTQGYYSGYDHVNGRVTGLHSTWLVPCTRASSNDVDGLLTLRVDPLEEGRKITTVHTHVDILGFRAHIFPFHTQTIFKVFIFIFSCKVVDISALVVSSLLKFSTTYFVYIPVSVVPGLCFIGTYNLVPRGTHVPYSASVDLVWVASQNVQEVRLGQLCWIGEGLMDWMEDSFVVEGILWMN
ncbi:hypothetical protein M9H77_19126 [Catharanthus roseus]|uniref:Uncharacterized protein n=1 Tax=Catharanthus roseus TaxID=4058 RepID=A0ACC0B9I3_CATRO|nr:hypothetical protein M9H77_19126 [Catharanthus roseus]